MLMMGVCRLGRPSNIFLNAKNARRGVQKTHIFIFKINNKRWAHLRVSADGCYN